MSNHKTFFDVIRERRSIRDFTAQKIEPRAIEQLLKAIQSAPTAGNLQAYKVYLVESPDKIKALARAAGDQECMLKAPVVLVFCSDAARSAAKYGDRGRGLYSLMDTTIAITIAHMAATALGLGSVMVGAFDHKAAAGIIDTPPGLSPLLMLPIGHPAERPTPTARRSLDEMVVRM